jgi:hypothetical protein
MYLFRFDTPVFFKRNIRVPMNSAMAVYNVQGVFLVNHRVTGASSVPPPPPPSKMCSFARLQMQTHSHTRKKKVMFRGYVRGN